MSLFTDLFQGIKNLLIPKKENKRKKIAGRKEGGKKRLNGKTSRNIKVPDKTKKSSLQKSKKKNPQRSARNNSVASSGVRKKKVFSDKSQNKIKKSILNSKSSKPSLLDSKSPLIGEVTHYFSKINVIVLRVDNSFIKIGDKINIKGSSTDIIQKVSSLQIESIDVKSAKRGQLVGLKVSKPAHVGDKVYKI